MSRYQATSRKAYFEHVLNKGAKTQKERIMKLFLTSHKPITRKMADRFFNPRYRERAHDEKKIIPWQSMTAHVRHLMDDGYLRAAKEAYPPDGIGICGVSGEDAQYLLPIGDRWENRRLFDGAFAND